MKFKPPKQLKPGKATVVVLKGPAKPRTPAQVIGAKMSGAKRRSVKAASPYGAPQAKPTPVPDQDLPKGRRGRM